MKLNDGQDEAWEELEKNVQIWDKLTGEILSAYGTGLKVEAGLGFPVFINKARGEWIFHDNSYRVGSPVEFVITGIWRSERLVVGEINPPESLKKQILDWEKCKQRFEIGEIVKGVVKAKAQFGFFLDLRGSCLGLVRIIDVADKDRVTMADMPDKNTEIEGVVLEFTETNYQVVLSARPSALERARKRGAKF